MQNSKLQFKIQNLSTWTQSIVSNKLNTALGCILIFLIIGIIFVAKNTVFKTEVILPTQEIDLPFDLEGPYAILEPRDDGNALTLNIKRASSYQSIAYELTYQSEGIDRGVQGTINLKESKKTKQSEYQQEILFGTCSQGFTSGATHCVFDKNVENGTLTLRIKKPQGKNEKVIKVYKMIITWHLQKPDIALGKITSADDHFIYETKAPRPELVKVGWSIVNDLSGVPKLPAGQKTIGKVYALNLPVAKTFPAGKVSIETSEILPPQAQVALWNEKKNEWEILKSNSKENKISAEASNSGIFAILETQK